MSKVTKEKKYCTLQCPTKQIMLINVDNVLIVEFQIFPSYMIKSIMFKIAKRPHLEDNKEGFSQILASVSDEEFSLPPKKKIHLSKKLEVEDDGSQEEDQSFKGVDVNENVFHEKNKEFLKPSLSRTSLFTFFQKRPRPRYPWSAAQTEILRSAVESKSFQFLPRTTTDKIFKEIRIYSETENFERKDVFSWFLGQKDTCQVRVREGEIKRKIIS